MEGTLLRYQKHAMGMKKSWAKSSAKLTWATTNKPAQLTLCDKDNKKTVIITLNNACKIDIMQTPPRNREHAFEITCPEEKTFILAAESLDQLTQWIHKLYDVANLRKDHLFGDGGGSGGGGSYGGSAGFENSGQLSNDGESELQDNLLYDSYESKTFPVSIKENAFTDSLNIHGNYTLQLDSLKLSLIDIPTGQILFSWPYRYLRRYGREKNSFSMEVGRRCTSGEGLIRFVVADGNLIFNTIQQYVSAMSGRNFSAVGSVVTSPVITPQVPPLISTTSNDSKQALLSSGVKVLPNITPRERTHSAGSRNMPLKPVSRPQVFPNRGTLSVDDVSSGVSTLGEQRGELSSAVSDNNSTDRSKLPSPTTRRAPNSQSEPEQHYDVASEPAPKMWPSVNKYSSNTKAPVVAPQRKENADTRSSAAKPKPNPRSTYSVVDKTGLNLDSGASSSELAVMSIQDSGDPGVYASLAQPPGSGVGDGMPVYTNDTDDDHIYDHLARQQMGTSVPTARHLAVSTKPSAAVPAAAPPPSAAAKPVLQDDCDMLYDHLDRGQTVSAQSGIPTAPSSSATPPVEVEDVYDTLSLDAPQASGAGQAADTGAYLISSYPASTVPEESEYAEANASHYYTYENPYEVPEEGN